MEQEKKRKKKNAAGGGGDSFSIYKSTCVIEDLFYDKYIVDVLINELLPPILENLPKRFSHIEPWLVNLRLAMKARSRLALVITYLVSMNENESIKQWICDDKRNTKFLPLEKQPVFFLSLKILTEALMMAQIEPQDYIDRLTLTVKLNSKLYSDIKQPLPSTLHQEFIQSLSYSPNRIHYTTPGDGHSPYEKKLSSPSLRPSTEMMKLSNSQMNQHHWDPLQHIHMEHDT